MSTTRLTVIHCDSGFHECPGDSYANGDLAHWTAKQQREGFKKAGWIRLNGKDYCEVCAPIIRKQNQQTRR